LSLIGFIWILFEWSSNMNSNSDLNYMNECAWENRKNLISKFGLKPHCRSSSVLLKLSAGFCRTTPLVGPPTHLARLTCHPFLSLLSLWHRPNKSTPHPPFLFACFPVTPAEGTGAWASQARLDPPMAARGGCPPRVPKRCIPTSTLPPNPSRLPIKSNSPSLCPASATARGFPKSVATSEEEKGEEREKGAGGGSGC
jgi:hypothetical protein